VVKLRLAVCDDDRNVLVSFEAMLERREYAGTELFVCQDAETLLSACRDGAFDMIFMDIMLGEDSGIETAAKAAGMIPGVRIVFITAHVLDYAEDIFVGVQPYGYIGKPIDIGRVDYYLDRARHELEAGERTLCVSRRGVDYRLPLSGVRYIESSGRQAFVHFGDETIAVYRRLDNLWEQLDERFLRCHQSYIVNLDYVSALQPDAFVVDDCGDGSGAEGVLIRISRNHVREARQRYFEHKGRTLI